MSDRGPSDAADDRDALLAAIGFKSGPLGAGLSRKVILDDAAGLRPAMVKARRLARDRDGDAALWQMCTLEGRQPKLLVAVWEQRRAAERNARLLAAQLDRLIAAASMLAGQLEDPGTEALAAVHCATEALNRVGLGPIAVTPLLDERMFWFLSILASAGGSTSGNDGAWNWINAFCDDRRPTGTCKLAEALGYVRTTHDSSLDDSTIHLTDRGREALALDSRDAGRVS